MLRMWRFWAHGLSLSKSGTKGRIVDNRRVEYRGGRIEEIKNLTNNLKGEENLELLN